MSEERVRAAAREIIEKLLVPQAIGDSDYRNVEPILLRLVADVREEAATVAATAVALTGDVDRAKLVREAILALRESPEEPNPASTVALMLATLKIARESVAHTDDNLIDLAGYAEVAWMLHGGPK